ncbi:MAG: choice-of-anchor Q domain-containing protein [Candidatus Cybelea sp.]
MRVFGFDFTGAQENLAKNGGSSVFLANGADGATEFAHNVVHDLPWKINTAIDMVPHDNHRYTGASCSVHDNVFHDIALGKPATVTLAGYAMYIACGSDSQVYNNLIYREGSVGIHCWHAADRVFIYNNTIYDAGTGIIVGTGDGGYVSNAFFVVANNIVAHSRLSIIAESSRPGTISASSEFLNNLLYDNGSDWYYDASGVNTTITAKMIVRNTLVADPMFVSETRFDFHLRSDSPAIRAGYGPGAPDHDLDGFARPRGPVDIGAYQGRVNRR